MPHLSAFTPLGVLRMQGGPSEAEKIYRSLVASLGTGNYAVAIGMREDAWCYAWARCLAVARLTLIHAGRQIDPTCVFEYLGDREAEWQIVPGPNDSLLQRRAMFAARLLLPRGARREAVVDALQTLLGTAFVWYRPTKPSEIVSWPAAGAGSSPMNLQLPAVERKRLTITPPITALGSPIAVAYVLDDASQPQLLVGDHLVVNPEMPGRTETVSVTAVNVGLGTFTATFLSPHDGGCTATTMPWPAWTSSQRFDLMILSPAAAIDPETRRKINDVLGRVLRGVSTWGIVQATSSTTAGPFVIGVSPIGATPFGSISFP
jgi:hypothetical protein